MHPCAGVPARVAQRFRVINASSALRCTDSNQCINVIQITSPFEFKFKFEFKRLKFSAHLYFSNHIRISSELPQPEKSHICISRGHFKYFQKGRPALLHIDSLFSFVLSIKLQTIEYHDLALQIRSSRDKTQEQTMNEAMKALCSTENRQYDDVESAMTEELNSLAMGISESRWQWKKGEVMLKDWGSYRSLEKNLLELEIMGSEMSVVMESGGDSAYLRIREGNQWRKLGSCSLLSIKAWFLRGNDGGITNALENIATSLIHRKLALLVCVGSVVNIHIYIDSFNCKSQEAEERPFSFSNVRLIFILGSVQDDDSSESLVSQFFSGELKCTQKSQHAKTRRCYEPPAVMVQCGKGY